MINDDKTIKNASTPTKRQRFTFGEVEDCLDEEPNMDSNDNLLKYLISFIFKLIKKYFSKILKSIK